MRRGRNVYHGGIVKSGNSFVMFITGPKGLWLLKATVDEATLGESFGYRELLVIAVLFLIEPIFIITIINSLLVFYLSGNGTPLLYLLY